MSTAVGGAASARVVVKQLEKNKTHGSDFKRLEFRTDGSVASPFRTRDVDDYYSHLCRLEYQLLHEPQADKKDKLLQLIMSAVIAASVAMIALEVEYGPKDGAPLNERLIWIGCEFVFAIAFSVEIIVGVVHHRWKWCKSYWNWLDLGLVGISITQMTVDLIGYEGAGGLVLLKLARVVRFARLIRLVKMLQTIKSLYIVAMALYHAFVGVVQVYVIMMGGLFFYATVATSTIGQNEDLKYLDLGDRTVEDTFGTIQRSMYSLFQLMTLEGFEKTTRPIVMREPIFFVYFASFVTIFTFGLLNMLVGLVVSRTIGETVRLEHDGEVSLSVAKIPEMRSIFDACDEEQSGVLTMACFDKALLNDLKLIERVSRLELPVHDSIDLFNIVDSKCNNYITKEEFVVGCFALYEHPHDVASLASYAAVRRLRSEMLVLTKGQTNVVDSAVPDMASEASKLRDLGQKEKEREMKLRVLSYGEEEAEEEAERDGVEEFGEVCIELVRGLNVSDQAGDAARVDEGKRVPPLCLPSEPAPSLVSRCDEPDAEDSAVERPPSNLPSTRLAIRVESPPLQPVPPLQWRALQKADVTAMINDTVAAFTSEVSMLAAKHFGTRDLLDEDQDTGMLEKLATKLHQSIAKEELDKMESAQAKRFRRIAQPTDDDFNVPRLPQPNVSAGDKMIETFCETVTQRYHSEIQSTVNTAVKESIDTSLREFSHGDMRICMQSCLLEGHTMYSLLKREDSLERQLAEVKYMYSSQQLPPENTHTAAQLADSRQGSALNSKKGSTSSSKYASPKAGFVPPIRGIPPPGIDSPTAQSRRQSWLSSALHSARSWTSGTPRELVVAP